MPEICRPSSPIGEPFSLTQHRENQRPDAACEHYVYRPGNRTVYDRRAANWVTINAYLYDVVWSDGLTAEAIVNRNLAANCRRLCGS